MEELRRCDVYRVLNAADDRNAIGAMAQRIVAAHPRYRDTVIECGIALGRSIALDDTGIDEPREQTPRGLLGP